MFALHERFLPVFSEYSDSFALVKFYFQTNKVLSLTGREDTENMENICVNE